MTNRNDRLEEELKLWKWLGDKLLGKASNAIRTADFEDLKKVVKNALFDDVEKQRFACAHEIAHTYFFDLEKDPPRKPYRRSTSRYWVEEGLCYELARRILIPKRMIENWMDNATPPCIKDFRAMMRSFFVSGELLAYRIHDLSTWNALILIFELIGSNGNGNGAISLYKVLKSGNRMGNVHVARKGLKVIDPVLHKLLSRAFKDMGEVVEEKDLHISIGNLKGEIASFGASYMGSYPPKVVAILCLR